MIHGFLVFIPKRPSCRFEGIQGLLERRERQIADRYSVQQFVSFIGEHRGWENWFRTKHTIDARLRILVDLNHLWIYQFTSPLSGVTKSSRMRYAADDPASTS